MAKALSSSGQKAIGETVIWDKNHNLIVKFSSEDAISPWGQRYEAARIKYAMLHRRDKIPSFLRTGKRPILGRMIMTLILERKLKKEVISDVREMYSDSPFIPECEQALKR